MGRPPKIRRSTVLPGLGLSLGITWFYLGLIVLIPLGGLFLQAASVSARIDRASTAGRALLRRVGLGECGFMAISGCRGRRRYTGRKGSRVNTSRPASAAVLRAGYWRGRYYYASWLEFVLFFAGYIVVMRWILPRFGVPT